MSKLNRKFLNRLVGALLPLIATAQETTARRERAKVLRQAKALRTRTVSHVAPKKPWDGLPGMAAKVVMTAYVEPASNDVTAELQAKWDEFRSWQCDAGFGELGERFKGGLLNLKRRIWKMHRNGDSAAKISRDLWYEFSGYTMSGPPDAPNIRLLVPPEFVEATIEEAQELLQ